MFAKIRMNMPVMKLYKSKRWKLCINGGMWMTLKYIICLEPQKNGYVYKWLNALIESNVNVDFFFYYCRWFINDRLCELHYYMYSKVCVSQVLFYICHFS